MLDAARLTPDIPFTVVGDGPMANRVASAAAGLPNLEYRGFVKNTEGRELLRSARACVMPSLWHEPGSLVGLEAMSEGTPVVSYRKGGLAEYVADADAGLFSSNESPEGLARTISEACSDEQAWERLSKGGREAAATVHARSVYLDSLEAVYRSALAGSARQPQRRNMKSA